MEHRQYLSLTPAKRRAFRMFLRGHWTALFNHYRRRDDGPLLLPPGTP